LPENEEEFGITELKIAAVQLHEMFVEYMNAGFNRVEAFELIRTVLIELMPQND